MKKVILFIALLFQVSLLSAKDGEAVSIISIDDGLLEIKGHYYYSKSRPSIPIIPLNKKITDKKDNLYILWNEQKHQGKGEGYFQTITLEKDGKTQDFISLQMNEEKKSIIERVKLKKFEIVKTEYVAEQRRIFDAYESIKKPCWDVKHQYQIQTNDGLTYTIEARIRKYTRKEANDIERDPWIHHGDTLLWGDFKEGDGTALHSRFHSSQIFHNGQQSLFDELTITGQRRTKKTYPIIEVRNNLFQVKNHLFYFDPKLDLITKNVHFIVASEEYTHLVDDSYTVTIGLFFPDLDQIRYFESMLTNDNDHAAIDKVISTSYTISDCGLMPFKHLWVLTFNYEVILKDGTSYLIKCCIEQSKQSGEISEANELISKYSLKPGDVIYWGPDFDNRYYYFPKGSSEKWYFYFGKIVREGVTLPFKESCYYANFIIEGPLRRSR